VADHAIFFHDYQDSHSACIGGKCASLGAMTVAGLPVPPGFAVTTHAFADSMRRDRVGPMLRAALDELDVSDLHALSDAAAKCRQLVLDAGPSPAAEATIRAGYRQLCEQTGVGDVPVAVRSSSTAEDMPDASFAGQQDTYLWIRGADNVVNHVVRCWASLFTDRAVAYRRERGYALAEVAMSVAVQQMVLPKAAGVAFTLNPTNGDRSTIVIDSAFGLGEPVVSGTVTPDNFMIDKVVFEITKRTVSAKELECCVVGDSIVERPLDAERSTSPSLTDVEIKEIAKLARRAEKHFGSPQDV
jgi:pyruvate,water dikinase